LDKTGELQGEVASLQAQTQELTRHTTDLEAQLAKSREEESKSQARANSFQHSIQVLEEKISTLHEQNEFWEEEGKKFKTRMLELENTVQIQEMELKGYRQQSEKLGAASSEVDALSAQLKALRENHQRELADVKKDLEKSQRDRDAAEVQKMKALKTGEILQAKLVESEEQLKKFMQGAEGQAEMSAQIAQLKDKLEKREANLTRSENIIKKLMAEVEELKK